METVGEFTYLGDRVSAGGVCEAAMTARTRCEWVKLRVCGELLHGRRSHLKLKVAVYQSYVWPAILHRSEAWCLKGSEVGILQRTKRSMVRAIVECSSKTDRRYMDLMFMLGLKETIDQLAMANSVRWYGHVLRREDGHALRRALDFEVKGQRKKGKTKEEGEAKEDVGKAG